MLIEDVAFHIENLPEATEDLQNLLEEHGYDDACIYGHALEGNFHFILAQSFDTPEEIERYKGLMRGVERLVVDKYDGSLKAEHGTGRNMAPFVKLEWGEKAYSVMKAVKTLFDPEGIINPGVIFNDDPDCYVKCIKPMPLTNPKVDRCIECGFCEVNCLTCGFTLSSRQRIIIQREISRLRATGEEPERLARLVSQFAYYGNETCAGDGLCSTSCPMNINVGEMIHDLRAESLPKGSLGYKVGDFAARRLNAIEGALRPVLSLAGVAQSIIGDRATAAVGRTLHKAGLPQWTPAMPSAHYGKSYDIKPSEKKVVYFPSCINQTMGRSKQGGLKLDLVDEMVQFLQKAGWEVIFPAGMKKLCCGMIWDSKGMPEIGMRKLRELEDALYEASSNGRYPVMCDQSPCLARMRKNVTKMKLYEPVEFIYDYVADSLEFTQKPLL